MYNIEKALKEQIQYCHELSHYICGVYIKRLEDKKLVANEMTKLIIDDDNIEKFINSQVSTVAYFKNGSCLRIICASENARGYKNHGAIIDNEIEYEILNCVILPTLIPRWFEEDKRESREEVKKRIFYFSL